MGSASRMLTYVPNSNKGLPTVVGDIPTNVKMVVRSMDDGDILDLQHVSELNVER